jgi:hypothetical protein
MSANKEWRKEAASLVEDLLPELVQRGFSFFEDISAKERFDMTKERNGKSYQIGVTSFWDPDSQDKLRVFITAEPEESTLVSSFAPYAYTFVISRSGEVSY